MNNSIPLNDKDFPEKDHWGHAWKSPSQEFGLTMSCPPEVGWLLYGIVRATKPLFCVETGTHKGLSAMFIGSALRDNGYGKLATIDIENRGQEKIIRDRGISDEWISCHIMESTSFIPFEKIDFLFLDAEHGYDAVIEELEYFRIYLSGGAIICIDDSRIVPEEQHAAKDFIKAWNDDSCMVNGFQFLTSRGLYIIKYGQGYEEAEPDDKNIEFYRKLKNFCKQ